MRVTKRNGTTEVISFDKITRRITKICNKLNITTVDPIPIVQSIITYLVELITTTEIDEITARILMSLSSINPDYQKIAGIIIISNLHKTVKFGKFSDKIKYLYDSGLISDIVYNTVTNNKTVFNKMIDYTRDFNIDYFGFKTLERSYLQRVDGKLVECPQDIFMRVSIAMYHDNFSEIEKSYNVLSKKLMTHATPTLFNVGTKRQQAASCFLMANEDSIEGIYKCLSDSAKISKWAGGIGIGMSDIRANGSDIQGTNGKTTGLIPMLRVFNETARYVNQGGRRPGSIAVYLEPHHPDFMDFLDIRKSHGDENMRARDLFTAIWVSDLFLQRVKDNAVWSFLNPHTCPGLSECYGKEYEELYNKYESDGNFMKQLPAVDVWKAIITSQIETGTPYIANKDAVNLMSNQKNVGVIKSSNLCVAPETMILTDTGYHSINSLHDKTVNVWNGQTFSETIVRQTSENQELMRVKFSNGSVIDCTPYHKFYIETGSRPIDKSRQLEIRAQDLKLGMKLIQANFPIITKSELSDESFPYPYDHGLFCADGTYENKQSEQHRCISKKLPNSDFCGHHKNISVTKSDDCSNQCVFIVGEGTPRITLYGEKKKLHKYLSSRLDYNTDGRTINCKLSTNIRPKFEVPTNHSLDVKLRWLEGYLDGDGCCCKSDKTTAIQACSIDVSFLENIKYLLQTLGCDPKITKAMDAGTRILPDGVGGTSEYQCKETYRLLINSHDTALLFSLGFNPKRLKISGIYPIKVIKHYIKVDKIEYNVRMSDTYCFTEQKRNMGIFNGILAGNCIEIMEHTSPKEYAVCTLGSICLPMMLTDSLEFDFELLRTTVHQMTKNLNRLIDINFYPVPETEYSNMLHRPIGIGMQGLADVFFALRLPYDSEEAMSLNKKIIETMYYAALECSCDLSKTLGSYSTFEGSDLHKGIFHFERFAERTGTTVELSGMWDFESLRTRIQTVGVRNSLLIALMPTASTAQIMGNTESFEPVTANIYSRKTLAGDFIVINKFLIKDLISLGVWSDALKNSIIENNGSIQHIQGLPQDILNLYKTTWELKQRVLIDLSVARTPFVCQSQSLNLYFKTPTFNIIHSALMYGWRMGLKTMIYYNRSLSVSEAAKFTVSCESCSG
jgi:ribonucleoside-diphosphate reductase alpha chain